MKLWQDLKMVGFLRLCRYFAAEKRKLADIKTEAGEVKVEGHHDDFDVKKVKRLKLEEEKPWTEDDLKSKLIEAAVEKKLEELKEDDSSRSTSKNEVKLPDVVKTKEIPETPTPDPEPEAFILQESNSDDISNFEDDIEVKTHEIPETPSPEPEPEPEPETFHPQEINRETISNFEDDIEVNTHENPETPIPEPETIIPPDTNHDEKSSNLSNFEDDFENALENALEECDNSTSKEQQTEHIVVSKVVDLITDPKSVLEETDTPIVGANNSQTEEKVIKSVAPTSAPEDDVDVDVVSATPIPDLGQTSEANLFLQSYFNPPDKHLFPFRAELDTEHDLSDSEAFSDDSDKSSVIFCDAATATDDLNDDNESVICLEETAVKEKDDMSAGPIKSYEISLSSSLTNLDLVDSRVGTNCPDASEITFHREEPIECGESRLDRQRCKRKLRRVKRRSKRTLDLVGEAEEDEGGSVKVTRQLRVQLRDIATDINYGHIFQR